MNIVRYQYSPDWYQGSFSATSLDTVTNISVYGHPALVPGVAVSSSQVESGAQLLQSALDSTGLLPAAWISATAASPAWTAIDQFMLTTQAGDAISFTTNAQSVTIWFAGLMTSGQGAPAGITADTSTDKPSGLVAGVQSGVMLANQIRNGVIATIKVNGNVVGQVNTYNVAGPTIISGLTGTSTIRIEHSGSHNGFQPWTNPTNVSGTLLAPNLSLSPLTSPTFVSAQWRVVANVSGGGTWKIQKLISSTWTDQVTGLAYGATDTTHVPGMSVSVPSAAYGSNDTAQFNTDVTMLAINAAKNTTGVGTGAGTYTSAILDSGFSDTQWFLAEWQEGSPLGSFSISTGNTSVPDASWSTTIITPSDVTIPSGTRMGFAGLASTPRGRYAQWSVTFTPSLLSPFIRDLVIYYWVPERDPTLLSRLPLIANGLPGPLLATMGGTLAVSLRSTRTSAIDLTNSYALSSAVDQYLQAYGDDLGLPQYPGEPPQAYRARLVTFLKSRSNSANTGVPGYIAPGGSIGFIAQMVAQLTQGSVGSIAAGTSLSMTTPGGLLTATCNGVIVSQKNQGTNPLQYIVTVPSPTRDPISGQTQYPGLPGLPTGSGSLAQTIVTNFVKLINPVGAVPTITFS